MNLRARLILTQILLVLLPLALLGWLLRDSMSRRLGAEYDQRVDALLAGIDQRLERQQTILTRRLAALRTAAVGDQALLLAIAGLDERRPYLQDFVVSGRTLSGLDHLVLAAPDGRRLATDPLGITDGRPLRLLCRALVEQGGRPGLTRPADLAPLLRPDPPQATDTTPPLALMAIDSLTVSGLKLYLVGGVTVDADFVAELSGSDEVTASLVFPGGALTGALDDLRLGSWLLTAGSSDLRDPQAVVPRDAYLARGVPFPAVTGTGAGAGHPPLLNATLVLTHPRAAWYAELRDLDLWLLAVLLLIAVGTVAAGLIAASRITRPLSQLADGAARLDLDTLDGVFPVDRSDEVGALARYMDAMQQRLRLGLDRLRESERRAALGDLARQVTHDIRNGFLPLRNVIRHLGQVADSDPARLPRVFVERRPTMEASLQFLETLAGNYRRLSAAPQVVPLDLAALVRGALAAYPGPITLALSDRPLMIEADATALRRVVQNLVRNALQSLTGTSGGVRVSVFGRADPEPAHVLQVADDGRGMDESVLARAREQFYTTRSDGAGLGLSIVQRLVTDAAGTLEIESAPDEGTTVTVAFPPLAARDPDGTTP